MKIWGVGYYADAMNAVGTKVISFPAGDIYESLSKGVIDGAFFVYTGMYVFGFWEMLKYIVDAAFRADTPGVWTRTFGTRSLKRIRS
jgi:TRAP-type C4-dicarboxylate transport system substrate-binding protein